MKIILAIDDTAFSAPPVREVASRPWPEGSRVRVVTVDEYRVPLGGFIPETVYVPPPEEDLEVARNSARAMVHAVATQLRAQGIEAEAALLEGVPAPAIVEEARRWGADLIVLGSHGRTRLSRMLMGSVAQWVVAHAPCAVEVVPPREGGDSVSA